MQADESKIETELHSLGLAPKTWAQVLETVKGKLPPEDWETFSRLHRNFTGYRSESTLARFYGFVFSRGLHLDINAYRYARIESILADLLPQILPGLSILDIGAGSGIIASVLKRCCAPRSLVVQDPCAAVRDELAAQGFSVLPHPAPASAANLSAALKPQAGGFGLLLCIDSLGEINSDDDGALAKPEGVPPEELPAMLEERYGFAQKLAPWKSYLAPDGRILLWEPFAYKNAMEALAVNLREQGWRAEVHGRSPARNYMEIRLN